MRAARESAAYVLLATLVLLASFTTSARAQAPGPVYIEIVADHDRTSVDPLEPFDIRFILHANGNEIQGMTFGFLLQYSNGNSIGSIELWPDGDAPLILSPQSQSTFQSVSVALSHGDDPDTLSVGLISFSNPWKGSGDLFRLHVTPTDTGTLVLDSNILIPPAHGGIYFFDPDGGLVPGILVTEPIQWPPQPDPVRFRISTSSLTDTLFMGMPGTIYFNVDPMGHPIARLGFILEWAFSNGNIVGPISEASGEITFSPAAQQAFESGGFSPTYGNGSDPESTWVDLESPDADFYASSDWVWSVTFQPTDTGTIEIHEMPYVPPAYWPLEAVNTNGEGLAYNFIPGRIVVVPCPYDNMGDVNQDAVITSSDLIYFVNYVFKSGPDPLPDRSVGDVNCSGGLGSSDIIYLVNHVFKSGAPPCACIVRRI